MNFGNATGRPEANLTLEIAQIVLLIASSFWGVVAVFEIWGLFEAGINYYRMNRSKINWDVLELRILLFFQMITFFALLGIESVSKFLVPFPTDQLNCTAVAVMNAIIYCFLVQATYLFFVKKSSLVAGFERGLWFRRIQWVTKWGLIVFMPLFAVPLSAVLNVGIVSQEGVCLELLSQIWFPAMFIFGNVGLSGALLYLFIAPLSYHFKNSSGENKEAAAQMRRVIRKNIGLTAFMVFVTTMNVIAFCVFNALVLADPAKYDYLLIAAHIGIITDCCVMCGAARIMTTIWLPARVRNWVGRNNSEQVTSDNGATSPQLPDRTTSKSTRENTLNMSSTAIVSPETPIRTKSTRETAMNSSTL